MKNLLRLLIVFYIVLIATPIGFAADQESPKTIEFSTLGTKPLVMSLAPEYSNITIQIRDIEKACSLLGVNKSKVITGTEQLIIVDGEENIAFETRKIPGLDFSVLQASWISKISRTEEDINRLKVFVKGKNAAPPVAVDPNTPTVPVKVEPTIPSVVVDPNTPTIPSKNDQAVVLTDLKGHWAEKEINSLIQKGVVKGDPQGTYRPNDQITRAEFVTLLLRALGVNPEGEYIGRFDDVHADQWYFDAVNTSARMGLVSGYTPHTFAPNDTITREQMATMIQRAMAMKGKDIELTTVQISETLNGLIDQTNISNWAREATAKTIKMGIIQGRSQGQFAPVASTTRAEAACMVLRMNNQI